MGEKEFNEIKSTIENAQKSGTLGINDTTPPVSWEVYGYGYF